MRAVTILSAAVLVAASAMSATASSVEGVPPRARAAFQLEAPSTPMRLSASAFAESALSTRNELRVPLEVAIPLECAGAYVAGIGTGAAVLPAMILATLGTGRDDARLAFIAVHVLGAARGVEFVGSMLGDHGTRLGALIGGALGASAAYALAGGSDAWFRVALLTVPVGATAGYRGLDLPGQ